MAAWAGGVEIQPPPAQSNQDFIARTQRASARMNDVAKAYAQQPPPPHPFAPPPLDLSAAKGARPAPPAAGPPAPRAQQPRRMSLASNASNSSAASTAYMSSRESFDVRPRSASFRSQASIDSNHFSSAFTTPQSSPHASPYASPYASPRSSSYQHYQLQGGFYPRAGPPKIKQYQRRAKPGEIFAELPGEVLALILEHLRALHLGPRSTSCATCWMRDCCTIALCARKWLKYARVALYEDIQLNGQEGPHMKKRTKGVPHGRLVLLRRTLRGNASLAANVRTLKVPGVIVANPSLPDYHDLVASVIMACPNFERLIGFHPGYDHSFSRLFHALSTRSKLKEMNWVVEPSPFQRQHRIRGGGANLLAPGDLQPFQSASFLDLHAGWHQLTSLALHCLPGATLTPDTMLDSAFRRLPSLKKLHVSHLPATAFNDGSLLELPALQSLALVNLPGITAAGLSAFATAPGSSSIKSLALVQINIESLPALARIFSNLSLLESFALVQSYPPEMPSDELIWLFPYLASGRLTRLHWDVPYLPSRASAADGILAKSISAGGFPELRWLRTPHDPEGTFQELCRPRDRTDKPSDRYRGSGWQGHERTFSGASRGHSHSSSIVSSVAEIAKSPTSPGFPPDSMAFLRDHSDLRQARLAAQARLEAARRFPRYFVNVTDEDGVLVEKYGIGAFIGTIQSKIQYVLTPDEGATDEGGGLVGMAELLGDCGEELVVRPKEKETKKESKKESKKDKADDLRTREGCAGRWNCYQGSQDKKDKDRWMHTERGRWRPVSLL